MAIERTNRFIVPIKPVSQDSSNITVVILASTPNPRMKTMPPVSLMTVDKQHNVLDLQVESIVAAYPQAQIVLVAGHDIGQVVDRRPKNVRIVENPLYEMTGEVDELRLGLNNVTTEHVIIIDGNVIFNAAAIKQLRGHGSCTLVDRSNQIDKDCLGVISNNSKIENIAFGVQDKWCYITYLQNKEFTILRRFINVRSRGKLCVFESLNYVTSHGGLIYAVGQSGGYLRKINTSKDLA